MLKASESLPIAYELFTLRHMFDRGLRHAKMELMK